MKIKLTQADAGERLLRVVGEISIQHPTVIAWVAVKHLGYGTPFVFAEIEDLLFHHIAVLVDGGLTVGIEDGLPDDAACEVHVLIRA